jgi:hypothetical protein
LPVILDIFTLQEKKATGAHGLQILKLHALTAKQVKKIDKSRFLLVRFWKSRHTLSLVSDRMSGDTCWGEMEVVAVDSNVVEVDNNVYRSKGYFKVVNERMNNCLRSCDYKWSNSKHSYTMMYNNIISITDKRFKECPLSHPRILKIHILLLPFITFREH